MSILQNVFGRPAAGGPASNARISELFVDSLQSDSGVNVSTQGSLTMPAVWRAVNLIAGTVAGLPLELLSGGSDGTLDNPAEAAPVPAMNVGAAGLLAKPHPDLSRFKFWELVVGHIALWGNAYLLKLPGLDGTTEQLWPIHPARVGVGRAPSDRSKVYLIDGDENTPYTDVEILHISGFGVDDLVGLSPIGQARQGIGLALAAESYGAKLFGSGSLMSGLLRTDQRLTPDQAQALKDRWQEKVGGIKNAHQVAVLDSGAQFQQLSIPPEDAQFIESRSFQIAEIARIFGVPLHMLMEMDKSTSWGTGIEQQGIGFIVYTLQPWLTRIEQQMSLLVQQFDPDLHVRYDVEGLLRGDTASRYGAYSVARQWGWLSINDIRRYEGLQTIENGDSYITPMNMQPVAGDATVPTETGAS